MIIRKALLALALTLTALTPSLWAAEEKVAAKNLDIYLCIGQSNMASRAPIGKEDTGVVDGLFLLNKENKWEPASFGVLSSNPKAGIQGYNRFSALESTGQFKGFSMGYTFAQELLKQNPEAKLGLVYNAIGGTSIKQWQKDAKQKFFSNTVGRAKIAMQNGTLKGIIWHQGESDKGLKTYMEDLKKFVSDLRVALGVSEKDVPFIAGQILPEPGFSAFNENILKIADFVPNSACISNEGTADRGDKLHFNAESQKLLGTRYAQAILKIRAEPVK